MRLMPSELDAWKGSGEPFKSALGEVEVADLGPEKVAKWAKNLTRDKPMFLC